MCYCKLWIFALTDGMSELQWNQFHVRETAIPFSGCVSFVTVIDAGTLDNKQPFSLQNCPGLCWTLLLVLCSAWLWSQDHFTQPLIPLQTQTINFKCTQLPYAIFKFLLTASIQQPHPPWEFNGYSNFLLNSGLQTAADHINQQWKTNSAPLKALCAEH